MSMTDVKIPVKIAEEYASQFFDRGKRRREMVDYPQRMA